MAAVLVRVAGLTNVPARADLRICYRTVNGLSTELTF